MVGPPYPVPNAQAPVGHTGVDPVTGAVGGGGNVASYAVSTAGTSTVATGRSTPGGLFLGAEVVSGTPVYQAFDVIGTVTNALTPITTATLGQQITPAGGGVAVRFLGNLVVVVTGTSVTNTLWD